MAIFYDNSNFQSIFSKYFNQTFFNKIGNTKQTNFNKYRNIFDK